MGRSKSTLAAAVVAMSLVFAAPVVAQDDTDDPASTSVPGVTVVDDVDEAQPATEIVRDEDSSATVRRIRRDLVVVAIVTTVGLGVFVWHTSPTRRLRIATERAERTERTGQDLGDVRPTLGTTSPD